MFSSESSFIPYRFGSAMYRILMELYRNVQCFYRIKPYAKRIVEEENTIDACLPEKLYTVLDGTLSAASEKLHTTARLHGCSPDRAYIAISGSPPTEHFLLFLQAQEQKEIPCTVPGAGRMVLKRRRRSAKGSAGNGYVPDGESWTLFISYGILVLRTCDMHRRELCR